MRSTERILADHRARRRKFLRMATLGPASFAGSGLIAPLVGLGTGSAQVTTLSTFPTTTLFTLPMTTLSTPPISFPETTTLFTMPPDTSFPLTTLSIPLTTTIGGGGGGPRPVAEPSILALLAAAGAAAAATLIAGYRQRAADARNHGAAHSRERSPDSKHHDSTA